MPKSQKFYPNCQWTVTHCWPDLALNTMLLTKIYRSYSTSIVRVCFIPLLPLTLHWDFKRRRYFQIDFNSPAMPRLFELLCYHPLEHLDPIMDEFLTFIHSTLSPLYSFPAISTVSPEATNGNFNDLLVLRCFFT